MQVEYEQVTEAVDVAGLEERAVRADYSGRAMYGSECLGVVYDDMGEVISFAIALSNITGDDEWYRNSRSDSMGMSGIIYWPHVEVTNIPDRTEDEEEW